MAVIAGARDSHRGYSHSAPGVGTAEEVEQHRPGDPLESGIAVDLYIGLPTTGPSARVLLGECLEAPGARALSGLRGLADEMTLASGRDGAGHLREGVGSAGRRVEAQL